MSIIFCGGEDVDFSNGITPVVQTNAGTFRAGFARCSLYTTTFGSFIESNKFPGGAILSGWLSSQLYIKNGGGDANTAAIGFAASGTSSGIFVGIWSHTLRILRIRNGAITVLATSAAAAVNEGMTKLDLQLTNYGANGSVVAYINGAQVASFTGDLTISGVAGFDSVFAGSAHTDSGLQTAISEVIVADESTLGWQGLVTCAPNGNGTVQQWSNPDDSNFNEVVLTDANSVYVNAVNQDEQATIVPIPTGNFAIKCVKTIARANGPTGSVPQNLKVGFNNGSAASVGNAHALTTAFTPYEDYFANDPTTGAAWATLAGYQLLLRSA